MTHAAGGGYVGEWGLFTDWCRATGRVPLPGAQATVVAFLDHERPAAGTAARYLAGITAHHLAAGFSSPCRGVVTVWVAAARAGTPTTGAHILGGIAEAAARVPVAGWPSGMIGRRDRLAWLLHRLGGVTAEDLCALTTSDLAVTGPREVAVTVAGKLVTLYQAGLQGDPHLCIACAAARWAQVLRHHAVFAHRVLAGKLVAAPGGLLSWDGRHVCDAIPGGGAVAQKPGWLPPGWPLLYPIDRWGHPAGAPVPDPMAPRSLRHVLHRIGDGTWAHPPAPVPAARYDDATTDRDQPAETKWARAVAAPVAPSNPGWHRDGVAARTRGHALLADADAALAALDHATDRLEKRMQRVLDEAVPQVR